MWHDQIDLLLLPVPPPAHVPAPFLQKMTQLQVTFGQTWIVKLDYSVKVCVDWVERFAGETKTGRGYRVIFEVLENLHSQLDRDGV